MAKDQTLYCSFCGKSQHEVKKLIAGPTVFICDECVGLCSDIMAADLKVAADGKAILSVPKGTVPDVQEIEKILTDHIPDQKSGTKHLAEFLFQHFTRECSCSDDETATIKANNIVLIGESTVRNAVIQSLMRCVDRPIASINTMSLASMEDQKNVALVACQALLAASAYRFEGAQAGIIYIDDFDQICGTANINASSGKVFQKALFGLMPAAKSAATKESIVDFESFDTPVLYTNNVSFVFGGGFFGLANVRKPGIAPLEAFGMSSELAKTISAVVELKPSPLVPDENR